MNAWLPGRAFLALSLALILCGVTGPAAQAQEARKQSIKVPIVMEEATVRGKVAVLESRREDRKVVQGLQVRVWSTKEPAGGAQGKRHGRGDTLERDRLLHETQTDDLGLFDLPALAVGEYFLEISEVQFRLTVIPQSTERSGQSEPKVLLILVPKEVIAVPAGS
jgi:hypothetical protein